MRIRPARSIEPFGHRFMPAMYGCHCGFSADADPWSQPLVLDKTAIDALQPWTPERFERAEPVRLVRSQVEQLSAATSPTAGPTGYSTRTTGQ